MKAVPLLLLAVLVAAGCSSPPPPATDYSAVQSGVDAAAAKVLRVSHDEERGHFDAALHAGAYNMGLVGYANGVDDSGDPNKIPVKGSYTELAVTDGYAYLAGVSADGSFGGLSIVNIQDPAAPRFVSHLALEPVYDVEVNPEETLAFLSTQRNSPEQLAGSLQASQNPANSAPRGIYVVDISDKKAPTVSSFVAMPVNGPHTLTYVRHPNGSDYILACTYDLVTDPVTGAIASAVPATQRMVVFLVAPNPVAGTAPGPKVGLFPVAQFQLLDSPPAGKLYFPHDARVEVSQRIPGKVYIQLAYWDKGVRILDFSNPPTQPSPTSDPALPMLTEVGAFTEFSPSAYNNIHLAQSFPNDIAGHHVTVAEPEIISAPEETGQITFLDTSDPSHPTALGSWTLPPQSPALGVTGLDFSPHNFDTFGTKVALAHYHAGVWVIEAGSEAFLHHPAEVGFYMPAKPRADSPVEQPKVWGVVAHDGLLYASDEATGLHILRYTGP